MKRALRLIEWQFLGVLSGVLFGASALLGAERVPTRALHTAAATGDSVTVQEQLDQGVAVDELDEHGFTPLIWAIHRDRRAMALLLIKLGADVNAPAMSLNLNAPLYPPLCCAAEKGDIEVVRRLLEAGADPNAEGLNGAPIHWAVRSGHVGIAKLLGKNGANMHRTDANGSSPLGVAWKQKTLRMWCFFLLYDVFAFYARAWQSVSARGGFWWQDICDSYSIAWRGVTDRGGPSVSQLFGGVFTFFVITALLTPFTLVFCCRLAREKRRRVAPWAVLGLLPGPNLLALVYLAGTHDQGAQNRVERALDLLEMRGPDFR
ncbi:MAG: ankyrin repeat domain-containing protein [Lentisphaerae bacterium]|jgi:hypothetical protein|nr:ankyrin repeat domain-containing protein [Lentisphaerota bacterium]MBT4821973.1 ankyrin repeat domain-containing protein [Lentisphaerota bacterium]MBT5612911.1 ankyrin repeat domain-containing protein [Lentisphaerota bacterium]MBT7061871.1 ankyrin repeat domain-containing protein [Lentisphaerota bacterium]MBT7846955.1 ankyrin repeat domain-containing protein [Lentisphaerota bacterium]